MFSSYERNTAGSMIEYSRIIAETNIRVFMYAGDWDDTVPWTYTVSNIEKLGMRQNGPIVHWINSKTSQHIGFKRLYTQGTREIKLWIVKGAGREVASSKREAAL